MTLDIAAARALCDGATAPPWYARNRFLSRVPDNTGMGATLETNHIGVLSERDDVTFIAAARTLLPQALDQIESLTKELHDVRGAAHAAEMRADLENARLRAALEAMTADRDTYRDGCGRLAKQLVAITAARDSACNHWARYIVGHGASQDDDDIAELRAVGKVTP